MRRYIKSSGDAVLVIYAFLLFSMSLSVLIYDIVTIANGTVDPDRHVPFLVTIVGTILGAFCLVIVYRAQKRDDGPHDSTKQELDPPKDSYLHPDHLPKDRRDAPDGQSD